MQYTNSSIVVSIATATIVIQLLTPIANAETVQQKSPAQFLSEQIFRSGMDAFNAREYALAMRKWQVIAKKGNIKAYSSIGYLYYKGLGVDQSDSKALSWYGIAAAQGEPTAQYHMGLIYLRGKAVKRNAAEAYMWCDLAMKGGYPEGVYCRDEAANELTSSEIEKVEQRGRNIIAGAKS